MGGEFHADGRADMTTLTGASTILRTYPKKIWRKPEMVTILLLIRIFFYVTQHLYHLITLTHLILLILSNGYTWILQFKPIFSLSNKGYKFRNKGHVHRLPGVVVPSCGSSSLDTHCQEGCQCHHTLTYNHGDNIFVNNTRHSVD